MISWDSLFLAWIFPMLKIVNYADVLSENYTYPITVGKNIFSDHKLLVMLFYKGDWFDYTFSCCDLSTLMDKNKQS